MAKLLDLAFSDHFVKLKHPTRSIIASLNDKMSDNDDEKVLIYHFRGDNSILKNNYGQRTRRQLREILEDNPILQATTRDFKPEEIDSKGEVHIEVQQNDLYTAEQKEMYKEVSLFNYYNKVAGVYIKRSEAQHFDALIILSKKKD